MILKNPDRKIPIRDTLSLSLKARTFWNYKDEGFLKIGKFSLIWRFFELWEYKLQVPWNEDFIFEIFFCWFFRGIRYSEPFFDIQLDTENIASLPRPSVFDGGDSDIIRNWIHQRAWHQRVFLGTNHIIFPRSRLNMVKKPNKLEKKTSAFL